MVVSSRSKTLVSVAEKLDLPNFNDAKFAAQFQVKLTQNELEKFFQITKENMQLMYDACGDETWKWDDSKKLRELSNTKNRFITHVVGEEITGFVAFRFMVDFGDPVAYVWEIQVARESAGNGIGSQMMEKLENFMREKTAIKKIVLTVLKNNERAIKFYQQRGYSVDKSSPNAASYWIMSRIL